MPEVRTVLPEAPTIALTVARSERGSVAVVTAVALLALVGVLAFTLNTGYLYTAQDRRQLAVEAAAMAGAANLCGSDPELIVQQVAHENGIAAEVAADPETLVVEIGTYDTGEKTFDASDGDTFNAVRVGLQSTTTLLMPGFGSGDQVSLTALALAYLPRWGLISLDDDGEIKLRAASVENGDIYAAGTIKMLEPPYRPVFDNTALLAGSEVLECNVNSTWSGLAPDWTSGVSTSLSTAFPGNTLQLAVRPANAAYLDSLKASADVIYTPDQAGQDSVFFGTCPGDGSGIRYLFDLSEDRSERVTIFFDGCAPGSGQVRLLPRAEDDGCNTQALSHAPNGTRVRSVTFLTNCPVYVSDAGLGNTQDYRFGAAGEEQVIVITSEGVELHHYGFYLDGVVFRCGGDFIDETSSSIGQVKLRIIADGDIFVNDPAANLDFTFGPPCPPAIPRLAAP